MGRRQHVVYSPASPEEESLILEEQGIFPLSPLGIAEDYVGPELERLQAHDKLNVPLFLPSDTPSAPGSPHHPPAIINEAMEILPVLSPIILGSMDLHNPAGDDSPPLSPIEPITGDIVPSPPLSPLFEDPISPIQGADALPDTINRTDATEDLHPRELLREAAHPSDLPDLPDPADPAHMPDRARAGPVPGASRSLHDDAGATCEYALHAQVLHGAMLANQDSSRHLAYLKVDRAAWKSVLKTAAGWQMHCATLDSLEWDSYNRALEKIGEHVFADVE
ncbi:hypothetical protein L226DRAFT_523533 [Lentinus tigrinus ALCF2SS1-7]|uniref:uncharacterized protein n=1 Tax=Lentinus tigrinus ALCF2SS1-7 TaxID=1328758 RepID=UPI001165E117|nr:hypothetical protein L226DRAFT_523533 [Lentinus tigrinus ALCF2SS1-7]